MISKMGMKNLSFGKLILVNEKKDKIDNAVYIETEADKSVREIVVDPYGTHIFIKPSGAETNDFETRINSNLPIDNLIQRLNKEA